MKKRFNLTNSLLIFAVALISSLTLTQCKKDGTNAALLDRSFSSALVDTTVFSPFYDSSVISVAATNPMPDVNDIIKTKGVYTIIKTNCASASCHGGTVSPRLTNYAEIKSFVTPGNPEASKLWDLITTNDLKKAMPPVNKTSELTLDEKARVYTWIKNGAKEYPALEDYRPAAIRLLEGGCASANCHNEATAVGYWARLGHVTLGASTDTVSFPVQNQSTLAITYYPIMKNTTLLKSVWTAYKDSVKKFYADTAANASFRVYKVFSGRGPLNTHDDVVMDINYPKGIRSSSGAYYVNGVKVNSRGDYLTGAAFLYRFDSTMLYMNQRTGVWSTDRTPYTSADMAYGDGGFSSSDIAIIKGWYFLEPGIMDVWKYGINNVGVYKYRKTGNIIKK